MIKCPDCGIDHLLWQHNDEECLRQQVKNLKEENKRLSAEFTGKLTQSPLEMIRAKCEQYWNEPYTLCPEEMHVILEFIHQLAWSAEAKQNVR